MLENGRGELFIADGDPILRQVLELAFCSRDFHVASFADGRSLLMAARSRSAACILLDIKLSAPSSADILKELTDRNYPAPVFIMSGQCSIPMAVQAIKDGAFDLIEKPFDPAQVVARVGEMIDALRSTATGTAVGILPPQFPGRDLLTARECEILLQIALGQSNKESGRSLGVDRAPSRSIAHASWRSWAPGTPPISCASSSASAGTPTRRTVTT